MWPVQIVGRWKAMSPAVRREAVEVLFSRREGIEAVIGAFETRALGPSELDPGSTKAVAGQLRPVAPGPGRKILAADAIVRARSKPDSSRLTGRRSSLRGTASKDVTSSRGRAPPAIRPRAEGSTSVRTWRPSRIGRPRTC